MNFRPTAANAGYLIALALATWGIARLRQTPGDRRGWAAVALAVAGAVAGRALEIGPDAPWSWPAMALGVGAVVGILVPRPSGAWTSIAITLGAAAALTFFDQLYGSLDAWVRVPIGATRGTWLNAFALGGAVFFAGVAASPGRHAARRSVAAATALVGAALVLGLAVVPLGLPAAIGGIAAVFVAGAGHGASTPDARLFAAGAAACALGVAFGEPIVAAAGGIAAGMGRSLMRTET